MKAWALLLCLCAGVAPADELLPVRALSVVRSDAVRVNFEVEVARSAEQRSAGLMGRTSLPARHGMLFDFGTPIIATMWMKNTPLSLDMLFLDEHGKVVWIGERTTPESLALITAPVLVRYVLELQGGEARSLGLAVGDRASVLGGGKGLEGGAETLEGQ